ncbi:maleylpyruvate isomerase family mycothiol-dependent enzyme [Planotetraspora kaengkrachanensis]|uniref:Maleylpyruvate isomerase family mycothiol-dependent enzyme n=1 Tax=Planotetraspora kaengkrachanensis TaxID=575193 RepID=A0A8J3LYH4_9ACTN|nr:maleylpyruvate isomerase family mycothiol-dependent enzyme [Planotetraspora kaengkrachanensis]GIG79070.1 hypothetical protein Pka01_21970 [Planotetraspora kaengkrachanensis]
MDQQRSAQGKGARAVMDYERHRVEIVAQTGLLRSAVAGADLTAPVPSCPGWNLGQLLKHLGEGHRWAETIVRTRATRPPSDRRLRDLPAGHEEDAAELGAWLAEGAERLGETLRDAGPGALMWTPLPGEGSAFLARRFAHETAVHRADAALAVGVEYSLNPEVARDGLDEWMKLESLPQAFDIHPGKRELLGPGRTLLFQATDGDAAWLVDLTGDTIACRRATGEAAVTVRGPSAGLLLVLYGRRAPAREDGVEVLGDAHLLDWWLSRVGFGS